MKNTKVILTLAVIVVLVVGVVIASKNKKTVTPSNEVINLAPSATPTPTLTPTVTTAPTTSKYSVEIKAKVRSEFIGNCKTKGHYSDTECNCAADYLAKNYSEEELAKIYIQYRMSSQVPAALEVASKVCVKK